MSDLEHCRLAHEGKLDELKELLCQIEGLSCRKDQVTGRNAIHWACAGSRQQVVHFLHETFHVPLDQPDQTGWTPLMIASSTGCVALVEWLLSTGLCDTNATNETGQRPLHYAASRNHIKIVELLLESGADCTVSDQFGATPLHRAASKGNTRIAELLLSRPLTSNDASIQRGTANVNAADCAGNTPLHLACEEERVDTVKLLLKHHANPYSKNKIEKTPIDVSHGGLLSLLEN